MFEKFGNVSNIKRNKLKNKYNNNNSPVSSRNGVIDNSPRRWVVKFVPPSLKKHFCVYTLLDDHKRQLRVGQLVVVQRTLELCHFKVAALLQLSVTDSISKYDHVRRIFTVLFKVQL